MAESVWLGIVLAVLASVNLNVGKGIQKWKVKIWGKGKAMFRAENRRDTLLWLCGLGLTASAMPLISLALKYTDKSSMVSAFNGVGMIGLCIFAWLVLHEKIGAQELGGAALVLVGTALMGYFNQKPEAGQHYSLPGFLGCALAIAVVGGPLAVYSWKAKKFHGLVFGAIPGILIGTAMILGDMALVKSEGDFMGQLANPYSWAAIILGIAATVSTQFAFWRAPAMIVVPTINSFIVLTPVVIEYFTFGVVLKPVQYLGIAAVVAGVILLTATEKSDKIEGTAQEAS